MSEIHRRQLRQQQSTMWAHDQLLWSKTLKEQWWATKSYVKSMLRSYGLLQNSRPPRDHFPCRRAPGSKYTPIYEKTRNTMLPRRKRHPRLHAIWCRTSTLRLHFLAIYNAEACRKLLPIANSVRAKWGAKGIGALSKTKLRWSPCRNGNKKLMFKMKMLVALDRLVDSKRRRVIII